MFDSKIGNFNVCSFSSLKAINYAAKICHQYRTYLSYGAMRGWLNRLDTIDHIILLFREKTPIGSLIVLDDIDYYYNCNCGTWVHDDWRRKGVGRYLMKKAAAMKLDLKPWRGTCSAASFYKEAWDTFKA